MFLKFFNKGFQSIFEKKKKKHHVLGHPGKKTKYKALNSFSEHTRTQEYCSNEVMQKWRIKEEKTETEDFLGNTTHQKLWDTAKAVVGKKFIT